ncbi:MAG: matrixin family metalloprotease [Deltaproteobacteria bacterium]|nr:matrixin family metalloprotease [Deltaproteobacteria bacterium]
MTRTTFLFAALLGLVPATPYAFETNGRKWADMPVQYWVNPSNAPDFGEGVSMVDLVMEATGNWESVGCSHASFEFMGTTTAEWAPDGMNTLYFVSEDWPFRDMAAGATTWLPTEPGEPMEVDLSLNAADFQWVPGGGDALQTDTLDPVSVITHELGHWLGLAHSTDGFATMFQASLPLAMQASLAGDDKAGLCSLYPNGLPECESDEECPQGQLCQVVEGFTVCAEQRDPIGAFCSKDVLNCEGLCIISFYECTTICAFTSLAYDEGYCAPLCVDGECPDGWTCTDVPDHGIEVCFLDPPQSEAGPEFQPEPVPDSAPESLPEPLPESVWDAVDAGEEIPLDLDVVSEGFEGPGKGSGGCHLDARGAFPESILLLLILGVFLRAQRVSRRTSSLLSANRSTSSRRSAAS